jgi:hypothetical protein
VLDRLAGQLQIADPSCVERYAERRTRPLGHRDEIKAVYGLREFPEAEAEFAQWVRSRAWKTGQEPKSCSPTACSGFAPTRCCCRG